MENASRALLLAAGILLGLILLTSIMFMYNTIRESTESRYKILEEEHLLKYNAEFESYDKKLMYGTDVITVLNKAIDLNEQNEIYNTGDVKIDVTFRLRTDVENYIIPYKWDPDTKKYIRQVRENITGNKGYTLSGNKDITRATKYSIQNPAHLKEIENFLNTQTIKSEIKQNEKKGRTPSEDPEKRYEKIVTYYEMYYTGFSDFKRKIFTCTGIDYDPSSGKVCGIHFEEVNVEEYQQNQQSENNDNI